MLASRGRFEMALADKPTAYGNSIRGQWHSRSCLEQLTPLFDQQIFRRRFRTNKLPLLRRHSDPTPSNLEFRLPSGAFCPFVEQYVAIIDGNGR